MTNPKLEKALDLLAAAGTELLADRDTEQQVTWGVMDAVSLIEDAKSDIRGEIAARLPERPILDRRAS